MPLLELTTSLQAPVQRCFDLARSIDFHMLTTARTQETAVGGRTSGLIELGEAVTWRARHLGVWQSLTVKITALERPVHFQDVMTRGAFAAMVHDHHFAIHGASTLMRDRFEFRSPLGPLGWIADQACLKRYLRGLLEERASMLKAAAESEEWRRFVEG